LRRHTEQKNPGSGQPGPGEGKTMNIEEAKSRLVVRLNEIINNSDEPEIDHYEADKALLNFTKDVGCDVTELFESIEKWYA
jgi:hypothetical protein